MHCVGITVVVLSAQLPHPDCCEELLPALYGRVLIPEAVLEEFGNPVTTNKVRSWLTRVPDWLLIRDVSPFADPSLEEIGRGEKQAFNLRSTNAPTSCSSTTGQAFEWRSALLLRSRARWVCS